MKNADKEQSTLVTSRRQFVKAIPIASLVAAGMAKSASAQSSAGTIPSIQIPTDFSASMTAPIKPGSYEGHGQSGAEIFAGMCKAENLAALFCVAGNYAVINAIASAGITCYGGRSEGAMAVAAEGFSRVTGEVVACSGTEGPGITHMIQSIYTASAAHSPLLVLASNMTMAQDDAQSFIQSVSQQELTTGIKKYGKRLIMPNRIHEYGGYAFRELKSGVPGPVHLDFPGEVAAARFTSPSDLSENYDKSKYRSESRAAPASKDMAKAIEMIIKAERPLIIAGQGVFQRKAWDALLAAAQKHEIAVCSSGPTRGHFPDDHRLSAALSPKAVMSADLVVFIGQYQMPTRTDYRLNPDVLAIRVHPVQEDLGRNWPLDLGIVSDELLFLEELADRLPRKKRPNWVNEVAVARQANQKQMDDYYALGMKYGLGVGKLHPAVIGRELYDFFYNGAIDPKQTAHCWGGLTNLRFVPPYLRANRPGQGVVSYYQSGTIGAEINHGIGIAAALKEGHGIQQPYKGAPVLAVGTDGAMAYSLLELETAAKYRLPLIVVVYNNDSWGTWTTADDDPRALHMYLFQKNLRYDKAAEALGCNGAYVQTREELRAALKVAYDLAAKENIPTLINAQGLREFTSATLYPPGANIVNGPNIGAISH
jgi:thiamine pyrophosphate-dependent acetolactate synthase large subunit-like protein